MSIALKQHVSQNCDIVFIVIELLHAVDFYRIIGHRHFVKLYILKSTTLDMLSPSIEVLQKS